MRLVAKNATVETSPASRRSPQLLSQSTSIFRADAHEARSSASTTNTAAFHPIYHRIMSLMELGVTLSSDMLAAGVAALIAAPLVSVIDQATNLNAAGRQKLWPAIGEKLTEMVTKPVGFINSPAFTWLFLVYAVTYASANTAGTVSKFLSVNPALPVLVASTIFNMYSSIMKDAAFARMYGKQDKDDANKGLPTASYVAWFFRDVVTMAFVFTIPSLLQGKLPDVLCRLSAPVIAQYFTTPLHLLALAMFNLPTATVGQKLASVKSAFVPTVLARQLRILPAFSVAGVVNQKARKAIVDMLIR